MHLAKRGTNEKKLKWWNLNENEREKIQRKKRFYTTHICLWDNVDIIARIFFNRVTFDFSIHLKQQKTEWKNKTFKQIKGPTQFCCEDRIKCRKFIVPFECNNSEYQREQKKKLHFKWFVLAFDRICVNERKNVKRLKKVLGAREILYTWQIVTIFIRSKIRH